MQDAQTPQQALDIAAAATRHAHAAAAVPRWGPVTAGVLTALTMLLIETVIEDNLSLVVRATLVVAGIAVIGADFKVLWWMRDLRRARGVIPREPSPWKDEAVWWLALVIVPCLVWVNSEYRLWPRLLTSLILGGWIWYVAARPSWKSRLRSAPWKN